jgi:hypothetical protein
MMEQATEGDTISLGPAGERRGKRRFHIEREARYKLLYGQHIAETGAARTVNISSSGVWFTTDAALPMGVPIELSVSWPALLNDHCPMKLMIFGCVVRSTDTGAAINIERYEFRTQGSAVFQSPPIDPPGAHAST